MSDVLTGLAETIRALPREIANATDRWIIALHPPLDIHDEHGRLTDVLCYRTHREPVPYPCDDVTAARERIRARLDESSPS